MTEPTNTTPDEASSFTTCKRAAVRALRQAQGRIERGDWKSVATLIEEARVSAAQCAHLEGQWGEQQCDVGGRPASRMQQDTRGIKT